jgi:hypothetical protein
MGTAQEGCLLTLLNGLHSLQSSTLLFCGSRQTDRLESFIAVALMHFFLLNDERSLFQHAVFGGSARNTTSLFRAKMIIFRTHVLGLS